jgi:hypothetical protein
MSKRTSPGAAMAVAAAKAKAAVSPRRARNLVFFFFFKRPLAVLAQSIRLNKRRAVATSSVQDAGDSNVM